LRIISEKAESRELIRSALKNERSVTDWIAAIEVRLGTPKEQLMDAEVIAYFIHRLRSIQCVTCLAEEYGVTGNTAQPFEAKLETANPFPKGSMFNP
jgi:hypothetical protein